jgi:hypothetical protein
LKFLTQKQLELASRIAGQIQGQSVSDMDVGCTLIFLIIMKLAHNLERENKLTIEALNDIAPKTIYGIATIILKHDSENIITESKRMYQEILKEIEEMAQKNETKH